MAVKFTQFLFPKRTRKEVSIELGAPAIDAMAEELQDAGWRFEIENNPNTGMVWGDVCNDTGELLNFVRPNGPQVPPAVESLVRRAHAVWVAAGRPLASSAEGDRLVQEREEALS